METKKELIRTKKRINGYKKDNEWKQKRQLMETKKKTINGNK